MEIIGGNKCTNFYQWFDYANKKKRALKSSKPVFVLTKIIV